MSELKSYRAGHKDLGGFTVQRVIPHPELRHVGPFVFFDHMGPAHFEPGQIGIGVRPHPHIHLATLTYLFEGEILHRDSLGSEQLIRPGEVNLMFAGHGIVHSERESTEKVAVSRTLHGLQMWIAVPESEEKKDPFFHHHGSSDIPSLEMEWGRIKVVMGEFQGAASKVRAFSPIIALEVQVDPGQAFEWVENKDFPSVQELGIFCPFESTMGRLNGETLKVGQMTFMNRKSDDKTFTPLHIENLDPEQALRFVVLGGDSVGERHLFWNFVSSSREAIESAKVRWQRQEFPKVPGDDQEFIPLPS